MAVQKIRLPRSNSPLGMALDLIGDRWTLLIVRDMLNGKAQYGEFLESAEGITTNILADRLKFMEDAGLITRAAYQQRPTRYGYHLTPEGEELGGILGAINAWAARHL